MKHNSIKENIKGKSIIYVTRSMINKLGFKNATMLGYLIHEEDFISKTIKTDQAYDTHNFEFTIPATLLQYELTINNTSTISGIRALQHTNLIECRCKNGVYIIKILWRNFDDYFSGKNEEIENLEKELNRNSPLDIQVDKFFNEELPKLGYKVTQQTIADYCELSIMTVNRNLTKAYKASMKAHNKAIRDKYR